MTEDEQETPEFWERHCWHNRFSAEACAKPARRSWGHKMNSRERLPSAGGHVTSIASTGISRDHSKRAQERRRQR